MLWNRLLLIPALALLAASTSGQIPCANGVAGGYPCSNVDLLSFMPRNEVGGSDMNDIWGWVDPVDGTEYVLLGRVNGTAFIDISDPINPVFVANLPTATNNSTWRDIKVFANHAFIVSEADDHGMQVVDLTQLGNIQNPPQIIEADALYNGWGDAHNIAINESTGRAYGVGTNTFDGGLHILDINDPLNPTLIGSFEEDGYTHDAQVVSYIGPDPEYQGKEIAFCCNENTITIVDVTDATDATLISSTGYANSRYTHQGWLTEDHHFFISNDELDEEEIGVNTTSFIWDVSDLSAPELIGTFVAETGAVDHNMYVHDDLIYQSNYRAGLRILDTEGIADGQLEEVAFFDVYPSNDIALMNGTWSNYPYFPSGIIAVSHIEEGLFLLELSGEFSDEGCTDPSACNYDPSAIEDNGTCLEFNACGGCEGEDLFCVGCTDAGACNFSSVATIDDGSCFEVDAPQAQSAIQTDEPVTFTTQEGSHWFETESASSPLFIGPSYTLPFVAGNQSVWVAHSDGEFNISGGKPSPDFNDGQYHTNNAYWLIFDVHEDAILESVDVYSEDGGLHIIQILDNAGSLIQSSTQLLEPGLNVFQLNATLPTGEGYQIRSGIEEPLLWRDDDGANVNYPYDIGGLASITNNTTGGQSQYTYYYFFYNWKMSSWNTCLSDRIEFNVTVGEASGFEEMTPNAPRQLVKMIDLTGREVHRPENQLVLLLYSDGSVEKRFVDNRW